MYNSFLRRLVTVLAAFVVLVMFLGLAGDVNAGGTTKPQDLGTCRTFPVIADTYANIFYKDSNFGGSATVYANQNNITFLQFDTITKYTGYGVPVLNAYLHFFAFGSNGSPDYAGAFEILGPWNEYSLTWNNMPATQYGGTDTATWVGPNDYYLDVTSIVQGWVDGNPQYGIAIKSPGAYLWYIASREHATTDWHAELTVCYDPPHEHLGWSGLTAYNPTPVDNTDWADEARLLGLYDPYDDPADKILPPRTLADTDVDFDVSDQNGPDADIMNNGWVHSFWVYTGNNAQQVNNWGREVFWNNPEFNATYPDGVQYGNEYRKYVETLVLRTECAYNGYLVRSAEWNAATNGNIVPDGSYILFGNEPESASWGEGMCLPDWQAELYARFVHERKSNNNGIWGLRPIVANIARPFSVRMVSDDAYGNANVLYQGDAAADGMAWLTAFFTELDKYLHGDEYPAGSKYNEFKLTGDELPWGVGGHVYLTGNDKAGAGIPAFTTNPYASTPGTDTVYIRAQIMAREMIEQVAAYEKMLNGNYHSSMPYIPDDWAAGRNLSGEYGVDSTVTMTYPVYSDASTYVDEVRTVTMKPLSASGAKPLFNEGNGGIMGWLSANSGRTPEFWITEWGFLYHNSTYAVDYAYTDGNGVEHPWGGPGAWGINQIMRTFIRYVRENYARGSVGNGIPNGRTPFVDRMAFFWTYAAVGGCDGFGVSTKIGQYSGCTGLTSGHAVRATNGYYYDIERMDDTPNWYFSSGTSQAKIKPAFLAFEDCNDMWFGDGNNCAQDITSFFPYGSVTRYEQDMAGFWPSTPSGWETFDTWFYWTSPTTGIVTENALSKYYAINESTYSDYIHTFRHPVSSASITLTLRLPHPLSYYKNDCYPSPVDIYAFCPADTIEFGYAKTPAPTSMDDFAWVSGTRMNPYKDSYFMDDNNWTCGADGCTITYQFDVTDIVNLWYYYGDGDNLQLVGRATESQNQHFWDVYAPNFGKLNVTGYDGYKEVINASTGLPYTQDH